MSSTRKSVDYPNFLLHAQSAVDHAESEIVSMAKSGELPLGRWHPTGFAVFEIQSILGVGLMRLHCWPAGVRRAVSPHPQIHQHCFDLYSKVVSGTYTENQFQLTDLGKMDEHTLSRYRVASTYGSGHDALEEERTSVVAHYSERDLVVHAGGSHELQAGVYHETPIPSDWFCATIAVLSIPVPGASDALLGEPHLSLLKSDRPIVTRDEALVISKQIGCFAS